MTRTVPFLLLAVLLAACKSTAPSAATDGAAPAAPREPHLTPAEIDAYGIQTAPLAPHAFDTKLAAAGELGLEERDLTRVRTPVADGALHLEVACGQRVAAGDVLASPAPPAAAEKKADAGLAPPLRAPKAGEVLAIEGPSDVVGASACSLSATARPGVLEITLGERDPLEVTARVSDLDAPKLLRGQRAVVHVERAGKRASTETAIEWIAPAIDAASRTLAFRARVPNPDKALFGGSIATVEVILAEDKALAVPRSAVTRLSDLSFIFVRGPADDSGKTVFRRVPARLQPVEGSEWLKVEEGLAAGDEVVVSGTGALASLFPR